MATATNRMLGHLGDSVERLVEDPDPAAAIRVAQRHQPFAVGLVGRDRATPKRRGQADAQAA